MNFDEAVRWPRHLNLSRIRRPVAVTLDRGKFVI
jgi:hypothetical protein